MKPPRVFVEAIPMEGSPTGSLLHLNAEDSHHLRDVLRLREGAEVELCDTSSGIIVIGTISALTPVVLVALSTTATPSPAPGGLKQPPIVLLCALCKGQKNELIIDWGTELGCSGILFWESDHSVVRLRSSADRATKTLRYQKIALSAAKQSRAMLPPEIQVSENLSDLLIVADRICERASPAPPLRLMCSLSENAEKIPALLPSSLGAIQLLIGPEGDLSSKEEIALTERGFIPTTLGEQVLRSELAAVTAVVGVKYRLGL